jgi:hypothetical protein
VQLDREIAVPANSTTAMTVVGVPTAKVVPVSGPGAVIRRSGEPVPASAVTRRAGPSRFTSMVR